jgi:hypothetical protein
MSYYAESWKSIVSHEHWEEDRGEEIAFCFKTYAGLRASR